MRFGRMLALAGACALAGCVVSGAQPPVQAGTGLTDNSGKMSVDGTTVPVLPSTCVTGDVVVKTADGWTCQPPPSPNIWQDGPGIQIANHAISFYAPTVPATDVWPGTMDYSHLTDQPAPASWSSIASSVKATDAWPGTMPYSQLTDAPPVTWQTVASTVQRTDIWPGTLNYSQLNGAPAIPPAATWSIVKPSVQSTDAWPGTMDYSQLNGAPAIPPAATWSIVKPSVQTTDAWPGTMDYSQLTNAPSAPSVPTWSDVGPTVKPTDPWPGTVDYAHLTNLPANLGRVASDVTTLQGQMTTANTSITNLGTKESSDATAIATNTTAISTNTTGVANNAASISTLNDEMTTANTAIKALNDAGGSQPPGMVAYFALSACPSGWLEADGSLVSRTTYAALFSAMGMMFGNGDGSTTFALPDLRGEFIRGYDHGRGADPDRALGSFEYGSSIVFPGYVDGDAYRATASGFADRLHWNDQFDQGFQELAPGAQVNGITLPAANSAETQTNYIDSSTWGNLTTYDAFVGVRPRNVALLVCIKT